jgi:hypothetical protein
MAEPTLQLNDANEENVCNVADGERSSESEREGERRGRERGEEEINTRSLPPHLPFPFLSPLPLASSQMRTIPASLLL